MSLDRLKTFLEVYRSQSMGRAAKELGITQPAVSQQIQALETQLSRPLFHRTKRGVEPTTAADDLARDIAEQLDHLDQALAKRRTFGQSMGGLVHLGAPAEYFSHKGAALLRALVDEDLRVQVELGGRKHLYELLGKDEIDLAITASKPDARRFAFLPLGTERLLLVGAPDLAHRLRGRVVTADALLQVRCVAYDLQLPLIRAYFDNVFGESYAGQPTVIVPDLRTLTDICIELRAWSVIPDYLVKSALEEGRMEVLDAPGAFVSNEFFLVWKRSALRSPRIAHAKRLIESVAE